MTVEGYYRSIDPSYGSQSHQVEFVERMRRAQELAPCAQDHDVEDLLPSGRVAPRCHRTSCYPSDSAGRMVGS